jgi:hypothetical protein
LILGSFATILQLLGLAFRLDGFNDWCVRKPCISLQNSQNIYGTKNYSRKRVVDKTETHVLCPVQFYAGSYSL